jgi:glycosyltransferase involved in cell wall biosynthesis
LNHIVNKPPVIQPCSIHENRPLWSVMIPVYNCAPFLEQTLESVLMQDSGKSKMQIEVIDDASTDADIKSIVEGIGKGRIQYHRQSCNVGNLRNFETCINRARGYLIHLLHGDDKVKAGYYEKIGELFTKYPQIGAAFSRYTYIDEKNEQRDIQDAEEKQDGVLQNWLIRIAQKQRIQYCAMTVRREVYEKLGAFYGVSYGEDWEMWARIAKHYETAYTPEVLAEYRIHMTSVSGKSFLNAKNMRDLRWVMDVLQEYLPEKQREAVRKESHRFYAHYALGVANRLWHSLQSKKDVKAQVHEALRMHTDIRLLWKITKLYTKMALNIV